MSGCVLRAGGDNFTPEQFLSNSTLQASRVHSDSFNVVVSEAEDFARQCEDTLVFLEQNEAELVRLGYDAEEVYLDFGLWRNESPSQSLIFPVALVKAAAELRISLGVSCYAASDL